MTEERRIFLDLPRDAGPGSVFTTPEDTLHYVKNVLRLRRGDELFALDRASGRVFQCAWQGNAIEIVSEQAAPRHVSRVATLIVGLAKGDHNDIICEKACELGAGQILFWQCERSVVRLSAPDAVEKKLARFSRIAEAAAIQSLKTTAPAVRIVTSGPAMIAALDSSPDPAAKRFCCSLAPEALELRLAAGPPASAHLAIGPEGDFTPAESSLLEEHGFSPVSLGPFRLRTETAAIAAIAMLNGLWGFTDLAEPQRAGR